MSITFIKLKKKKSSLPGSMKCRGKMNLFSVGELGKKMSLTGAIMHSDAKCFKLTVGKLTVELPDHRLQIL